MGTGELEGHWSPAWRAHAQVRHCGHEKTVGVVNEEEQADILGATLNIQGEEKQQEKVLLPLSRCVSYRGNAGIIRRGHLRDLNRKKDVWCPLCMRDEKSIYIFGKKMCIPVYLPDALLDHIQLDNKKLHGDKNKSLPDKVLEKIIRKLFN